MQTVGTAINTIENGLYGFITKKSFALGITLRNPNEVLLSESDGEYYRWDGSLPKVVPPGSTPESAGGIGSGAWKGVGDAALRSDLAAEQAQVLVSGRPASQIAKTKYIKFSAFSKRGKLHNAYNVLRHTDGDYYAYRGVISEDGINIPSSPDSSWINVGDAMMPLGSHSLFNFGCVDDNGATDNRAGIQSAIEYMEYSRSVLYTDSSADDKYFGVSSFHPDHSGIALVIRSIRNTNIFGNRQRNASIVWVGDDTGEALFSVEAPNDDWGLKIVQLGADAGNKLNYTFKASTVQMAQCLLDGGCYQNAVLDNIHVSLYMSRFSNVFANFPGRDNFAFGGAENHGGWLAHSTTSLTIESCWSRAPRRYGYSFNNELWYSTLSATGCDGVGSIRPAFAYHFKNAKGVTLSAIGAEECTRVLDVVSAHSMIINGMQLSGIHAAAVDGVIPKLDAFIKLGGFSFTLSGLATLNALDSYFDNDVIVDAAGQTNITVLDKSFRSDRFNIVERSGVSYFAYPDIVYFPSGRSLDRGFLRAGNTLYPSPMNSIDLSGAGIVERQIIVDINDSSFKNLASITSGDSYHISVDIVHYAQGGDSYAMSSQYAIYKRQSTGPYARLTMGESMPGFQIGISVQNNLFIRASTFTTPFRLLIKIRLVSDSAVARFLL